MKVHLITGCKTNIVTAVEIFGKDAGDAPQFKPLVEKTAENFNVSEVPADKGYLSKENLEIIDGMGGTAYIAFKVNSTLGEGGIGTRCCCSSWCGAMIPPALPPAVQRRIDLLGHQAEVRRLGSLEGGHRDDE